LNVTLAIIGAGPAGLMAAEAAANAGVNNIHVFDAMPSVGRKLLLAGIGGLNITHSEAQSAFIQRYQPENALLTASIKNFDAQALRDWCTALGVDTFVGSSGRVFPSEMKAAPLLRAWLARLKLQGVQIQSRHRWMGWDDANQLQNQLRFETPQGEIKVTPQATVLALGGGSWRKLGSDGAWQSLLAQRGVSVNPLVPANCGFNVDWSDFFKAKCAGAALKNIAIKGKVGELVITANGIEGSLVYAHSAEWREAIAAKGTATVHLDLLPNHSAAQVLAACQHPRGTRSLASHLGSRLGLSSTAFTLLRECLHAAAFQHSASLAFGIKALPIAMQSTRPIDEAISSAGGVAWPSLGNDYQLHTMPGVFCAGEMLDWEAPTGGYLLTACWAIGRSAGLGAANYLKAISLSAAK
jgi:uncharacterized flavoprotein (TIGR03862 family)